MWGGGLAKSPGLARGRLRPTSSGRWLCSVESPHAGRSEPRQTRSVPWTTLVHCRQTSPGPGEAWHRPWARLRGLRSRLCPSFCGSDCACGQHRPARDPASHSVTLSPQEVLGAGASIHQSSDLESTERVPAGSRLSPRGPSRARLELGSTAEARGTSDRLGGRGLRVERPQSHCGRWTRASPRLTAPRRPACPRA